MGVLYVPTGKHPVGVLALEDALEQLNGLESSKVPKDSLLAVSVNSDPACERQQLLPSRNLRGGRIAPAQKCCIDDGAHGEA